MVTEQNKKIVHFLHIPWTGLGLWQGFRGNRWLRNRIKIFKQFVLPSLLAQTNPNFVLWCAWRYEERSNPLVQEFQRYLDSQPITSVHTFAGICFWDDKYSDAEAHNRLVEALHGSMGPLLNKANGATEVLMTIQPSDDVYHTDMVRETQQFFATNPDTHVYGYRRGYVMDYVTGRLAKWNPKTTPPFYTIRFPMNVFQDPRRHTEYTGPYKSHEYVKDYLPAHYNEEHRGFIVGTHFDNVSTAFDNPYAGERVDNSVLKDFALGDVEKLKISFSLRRSLFHKLPHRVKRKLRFWAGEKDWILRPFFAKIYNILRN